MFKQSEIDPFRSSEVTRGGYTGVIDDEGSGSVHAVSFFFVFRAGHRLSRSRPYRVAPSARSPARTRGDVPKWPGDGLFPCLSRVHRISSSQTSRSPACFRPRGFSRRFSPWRSSSASVPCTVLDVTDADSTTRESAALHRALITPHRC